jgi:hypothetical protein
MYDVQLGDMHVQMPRPHLRIRASAAKGGKPRMVPLWWDAGTLQDLSEWKSERLQQGVPVVTDPFVTYKFSHPDFQLRLTDCIHMIAPLREYVDSILTRTSLQTL